MASKHPVRRRVVRNPLVFVCGAAALFVLAVAGLPDAPADARPGHDGSAPSAARPLSPDAVAPATNDERSSAAPAPRALTVEPEALRLVPTGGALAASKNPDKKIAKLEAKIAKKESQIADKEAAIDQAESDQTAAQQDVVDAQQALADAEALPEGTKEELKAKKKAIKLAKKALKQAEKAVAKFGKVATKLEKQVVKLEGSVDKIEIKIDDITVGGLPEQGDPAVAGLQLPSRMSVVATKNQQESQQGDGGSAFLPGLGAGAPSFALEFPPQSDYVNDEAFSFVYDPSMDSLDTVNSILCQIKQTAYQAMVNDGPYLAQIDAEGCRDGVEVSTGAGSESANQTESFELWTVASVRTTESSEHVVGVWVPQDADDGPGGGGDGPGDDTGAGHIHARMEILEGITEANPFGVFEMDFAGYLDADTEQDEPLFFGTLESGTASGGNLHFEFFEQAGDPSDPFFQMRQVSVTMSADGESGIAHVRDFYKDVFGPEGGGQFEEEYVVAFDAGHLLRGLVGGDTKCLDRDSFSTDVWRYNLYHAEGELAGQRVDRNSGFPIRTTEGEHGWAGYWGVELHGPGELSDGQTVLEEVFGEPGDGPPAEYTVLQAPGKLFEFSREELPLEGLDGAILEWWEFPAFQFPDPPPPPNRWQVQYEHASGLWWKLALFDEQSGAFEALANPEFIDRQIHPWLDLWSAALGGSVNHLDGDGYVTFFSERVINGNDGGFGGGTQLDLVGFFDALKPGLTGSEAVQGDVFLPEIFEVENGYAYRFLKDDLTLYVDLGQGAGYEQVGLAEGEDYSSGPFDWGLRTGPLVPAGTELESVFDVWDQEVFYVYETGPNPWNRYSALLDDQGAFVDFDPPLQFTYTHSLEGDRNDDATYAGQTFALEYGGDGDLWGIPHQGVDIDGDGFEDRWYPLFSIADGTLMGPTGSEYVVRAIEMEQRLQEDPQGCGELSIGAAANLKLPNGNGYQEPNIGPVPVVTDPPAVIDGELQD